MDAWTWYGWLWMICYAVTMFLYLLGLLVGTKPGQCLFLMAWSTFSTWAVFNVGVTN